MAFSGKLMGLEVIVLSEEASMRENTRRNPIAVLGVATVHAFVVTPYQWSCKQP